MRGKRKKRERERVKLLEAESRSLVGTSWGRGEDEKNVVKHTKLQLGKMNQLGL